jgi:hypothetical protein
MQKSFSNIEPSEDYKQFMQSLRDKKHLDVNILPVNIGELTPVNEMGIEVKKFIKVSYDGSFYITTMNEVEGIIVECDDDHEYSYSEVWMTQEEFDSLPEFDGF